MNGMSHARVQALGNQRKCNFFPSLLSIEESTLQRVLIISSSLSYFGFGSLRMLGASSKWRQERRSRRHGYFFLRLSYTKSPCILESAPTANLAFLTKTRSTISALLARFPNTLMESSAKTGISFPNSSSSSSSSSSSFARYFPVSDLFMVRLSAQRRMEVFSYTGNGEVVICKGEVHFSYGGFLT